MHYFGTKDDLYVEILRENDKNELYELFRLNTENSAIRPSGTETTCKNDESEDGRESSRDSGTDSDSSSDSSPEAVSSETAAAATNRKQNGSKLSIAQLSEGTGKLFEDQAKLMTAQSSEHVDVLSRLVGIMAHKAQVPGLVELYSYMSVKAADKSNPAHAYFMERRNISSAISVPMLKRLQKRGIVSSKLEPSDLNRIFNAVTDGLLVQRLIDPDLDIESLLLELCTIIDWKRDPHSNPDIESIEKLRN